MNRPWLLAIAFLALSLGEVLRLMGTPHRAAVKQRAHPAALSDAEQQRLLLAMHESIERHWRRQHPNGTFEEFWPERGRKETTH